MGHIRIPLTQTQTQAQLSGRISPGWPFPHARPPARVLAPAGRRTEGGNLTRWRARWSSLGTPHSMLRPGPVRHSLAKPSLPASAVCARSSSSSSGRKAERPYAALGEGKGFQEDVDLQGEAIAEDYYSVLGLRPDASQEQIKSAYYACMKACHPDLSNNHPDSVEFCAFVNEVYEVLSDSEMRAVYDEIKGYSMSSINPFLDTEEERDFAFVDEFTCIGCKNCANTAESTFGIEDLWGRARVYNQRGDCPAKVQEAIDTCPVECIHWVSASQLALLEDEMRRVERVSVGVMMAGQGAKGVDVFRQASSRWERRRRVAQDNARMKADGERREQAKRGEKVWGWDFEGAWWADGAERTQSGSGSGSGSGAAKAGPQSSTEPQDAQERPRRRPSKEKMARAAEAARRWREYSSKGVDRRRRGLAIADRKWEGAAVTVEPATSNGAAADGAPALNGAAILGTPKGRRDQDMAPVP